MSGIDYSRFDKIVDSDEEEESREEVQPPVFYPSPPPSSETSSSSRTVETSSGSKEEEVEPQAMSGPVKRTAEGREGRHAFVYQGQLGFSFFLTFSSRLFVPKCTNGTRHWMR